MKISLDELTPAQTHESKKAAKKKQERATLTDLRPIVRAKAIAQEYVRNGMDFGAAARTVLHRSKKSPVSLRSVLGDKHVPVFMDEVKRLVSGTDIDLDAALNILWSVINASILDYFDENGTVLPVDQLKKMPRTYQILIHKIDVQVSESEIKDKKGNPILDDSGAPYLKTTQRVRLSLLDKQTAMNQLASIMKWIGPAVQINNNTFSVGSLMAEADNTRAAIEGSYEEVDPQKS